LPPKKHGGLGIKDLEKFGRALRLHWLWYHLDTCPRPWKNLLKEFDPIDREIFFASTTINIGNGKSTHFWEAKWLQGSAPKETAPTLYKRARFKRRPVHDEIKNSNWIKSLYPISSE
jgi:hypothetical protein